MADLNAAARKRLPNSAFAIPSMRKYPIQDKNHAKLALAMVAKHGTPAEIAQVKRAVHKRYPDIEIS